MSHRRRDEPGGPDPRSTAPRTDQPATPDPADETRTVVGARGVAPGDLLAGRYRLVEAVGRGGMGLVYRAADERLGVDVALKLLRPEHLGDEEVAARFTREILLARQVSHRHVVRIHDLGEDPERDLAFLTMDLVEGRSLKSLLAEEGRFAPLRAAALAAQLAGGLAAAHREGVVHRDLKPSNVLVDAAGEAHVTDFGIARSLTATALTRTGGVVGTPRYLSPEQARGEKVDARSDVYSLGLILHEMLSGDGAFPDGTFTEVVSQRIVAEARDVAAMVPEVPAWLAEVVRRCLRRDPDERYPDAAGLAADLEAGLRAEGVGIDTGTGTGAHGEAATSGPAGPAPTTAGPTSALPPARRAPRGRWGRREVAVAGVAVLVLAAVLWLLVRGRGADVPGGGKAEAEDGLPALSADHAVVVLPFAGDVRLPAGEAGGEETGGEAGAAAAGSIAVAQLVEQSLVRALEGGGGVRVADSLRAARTAADLGLPRGELRAPDLRQLADLVGADRVVTGRVVEGVGDGGAGGVALEGTLSSLDAGGVRRVDVSARGDDLLAAADALAAEILRRLEPDGARRGTAGDGGDGVAAGAMSDDPAALAAYDAGVEALLSGDAVAAAPRLERAVEADPAFAAAWVRLADARAALGRWDEAEAAAERAIAELPEAGGDRLAFEARSRLAALRGDTDEAADILQRLVGRHPGDAEARVAYGEAALDAGRFEAAEAALAQLIEVDPNHPRAWFLLGKLAILTGDYRRAADDYLVRALTIQNRLGNPQGRADAENALGIALLNLGELDGALRHYRQAAELRREIGDRRGLAATLSNVGLVESQRGHHPAARAAFEESLAIRSDIGDRQGVASLYNSLGFLEEEQGSYREALGWYRRALEERRALGDPRAEAESLNNVGFAYFLLGDLDNAAVYWDRTLEIHRDTGNDEGVLVARQNLGLLDVAHGQWDDALAAFLETLETARSLGLPDAEAVSLAQLGRVARLQGRHGAAFASLGQALARVGEIEDPRGLAEFRLMVAETALEVGLAEVAAASLEEAAGWLEKGGNRGQRGELARLRGELALARGDLAAARRHLAEATAEAEASGSRALALDTRLGAARAALAGGDAARGEELAAGVAEEAAASGLRLVELAAGEVLAAARLAAGRPGAAADTATAALATARRVAPWGRAFRLHRLRAEALEAAGDDAGAAWRAATEELARVRDGLAAEGAEAVTGVSPQAAAAAFAELPAVAAVDAHRAAGPAPAAGTPAPADR